MNKLSITIITKNEEKNIERCLESVKWADEIIVVDSGSIDNTLKICEEHDCKIIKSKWLGFSLTKRKAVSYAKNNWILSIDADEEITTELKDKIGKILEKPKYNAYSIKRISYYLGNKIKHCGWNRDFPLRLFDKNFGNFNDKIVHESIVVDGKKGRIYQPMLHFTYPTIESHIKKMDQYSTLGAQTLFEKNRNSTILEAILRGFFKFIKMYFIQLGFLDGANGFVLCENSAIGVYLKYLKLWKLRK
ncbi:MAG: glycosyltransferase family 2 protein [Candidatus Cloacimonetes bacterium]|nr:glycosyltransferase family 2 protein [Candidatus Cloacimonadota bacterium]